MILKKLSIFGFKSFADKTEIHFGNGMTAVIGPNGCGKTNVVDAIRWVFGEQRASILRGGSMHELIFSGTQNRKPLNLAEVTLHISNSSGILPLEYNEVAITRRIFRSGESEYLINRTPSRLRDIQNLFLDTGVGSNVYTTIENSMINRILSDKAEDRRILFEEAAGIGKYKQRIKESQRKLERTGLDLQRINDIVQEKERYVRMLGRQVEKARRYKRYHDQLMNLEVGYENRRYQSLKKDIEENRKKIAVFEGKIEALKAKIAASESRIEKIELNKVEKEKMLQSASRNVSDASEKINVLDREISVSSQSLTFLEQNVDRFKREIEHFNIQSKEKSELLAKIEECIITGEKQFREHTIKVDAAKKRLEEFDKQVMQQRKKLDDLSMNQLNLVHNTGEKERRLSNCQTNLSNSIERREHDENEMHKLKERLSDCEESLEKSRRKLETASEAFKNHIKTRETLLDRIEKEDARYHSFIEREKHLEAFIDSSQSKLQFLEGLEASFEGYGSGVKALLEKNLKGTMGVIADIIEVGNTEMIDTVERLLGNVIQTVVFKTDKDLREAVKYLSSENVGIARMISLESLSSRPQVTKVDTSEPLRKHITAKDINTVIADYLFNRVLVCDTTKDALELQLKVEDNTVIVSRDGVVCYSEGTVVAGSKENEQCGIFKRKKEIEKLIADIEMYKNEYDTVIHDKEICIITRDEAKHALAEVDDKLNIGRQVQQEQETNIKHYETESININDRIKGLDSEIARNNLDIEKYRLSKEEYERLLKDIHNSKKELEGQIKSEKNCLADMDIERAKLYENLKDIELSRHGFANNIEQDKQSAERLKQDINNYNSNIQEKTRERESAQVEIKRIKEKIDILRENLKKETASREELQKTYTEIREDYNGLLDTIEEERREIKVYQNDLEDISDQKHDLDVVCTRDDEQLRAIREKIYNAYEIDLQSPPDDISVVEKEDSEIIESIHIFKERLRHVSDVNMGAIHEYEKESKDLKEILLQRDDLRTAVDDLAQAIKKLNREARVQFKETFDSVKKRFMEMFTTLFEGGEVSLTLEENVDPLYADIKIDARPAGKKMRGISLLSGGEKALTAISLLFAMYMVKPSAYCILDELDAPLDDANIERFIRILRKFSDKTQFIIVTHNKHTMEAADLLYGVTQEESGVSTVASVLPSDSEQLRAA